MDINTKLTKQHLSTKVFKTYFEYLRLNHPEVDINQICEKAGLPYDYLKAEDNWVSVVFDQQFTEECIKETGVSDLCFKVGQIGITARSSGTSIYYILKYARSLKQIHFDGAKYTQFFNKVMEVNIVGSGHQFVIMKISPLVNGLNNVEKEAFLSNLENIIDNLVGFYSVVPSIRSLPNSNIELRSEIENGLPHYYLHIKYPLEIFWQKTLTYMITPIATLSTFYFLKSHSSFKTMDSVLISTIVLFCGLMFLLFRQFKNAKSAIEENEKTLNKLDAQYRDVTKTKISLQRKLKESQVINKITTHLAAASVNEDPMKRTCEELVNVLKYDRAIILLADELKKSLNYHCSFGLQPDFEEKVQSLKLAIDIKNNDPKKISNVYRTETPILITNVTHHLETLEDEESKEILSSSGSKSFICTPISNQDQCYGILLVDYFDTPDELEIEDVKLLTMVGKQAALFLGKDLAQKQTIEAYQQSNRLKDQFLASTTHELKTPLHGIIGIAESLIDGDFGKFNNEAIGNLKMIASSGKRLASLVNDVLDYSKMRHKDLHLHLEDLNLYNVLSKVIANISINTKKSNVKIINKIPQEEFFILADNNRLQQIFFNLIGNSLKFTIDGEIEITAERDTDDLVKVIVSDSGTGIPEDKLDKICDAFYQVDSKTSVSTGGTGLGLSITKDFVQLHGGTLDIKSKIGQGTTISFTLQKSDQVIPAEKVYTPKNLLSPKNVNTSFKPIKLEGMALDKSKETVLIVDDEPVNIQVLDNYLRNKDLNIITAENGQEAVDLIKNGQRPDIVLLDIMMPVMDGYDACKEIRKLYSETELPIIFLTAKREEEDLIKGFQCGANDYLAKPFSKTELLARLQAQLSSSRLANAYSRFVPWSVLEILDYKSILDVKLGDGINREMTVLFIDIRNFTTFCENLNPHDILEFTNSYLERMSPIMHKHNGIIDKFIGDCIMVTFEEPQDAIHAGGELLETLRQYNLERLSWGWTIIEVGIGVHTGPVVIGPIGYEGQLDITVLADSVNIAARIESMTKSMNSTFIISHETLAKIKIPKGLIMRQLGPVQVKGKKQLVSIVELFPKQIHSEKEINNKDVEEFIKTQNEILIRKSKTIGLLDIAISEYVEGHYTESLKTLNGIDESDKADKAVQYYINLCEKKAA